MIIPSVDLLDGSIVKLRRGNRYSQIIEPISEKDDIFLKVEEYSKHFRALHVVNLNGAICQDKFIGKSLFHEVIQHATSLGLNVQAGGGEA
jgi:phosphoribosylformimino-5-aminoimidazole carboxamide ribonucleotide (ProFAR) isomerase